MKTYTIGELSRRTGVPVKTIRYYHEEKILEPHGTTDAGYRLYTESDEERLTTIRSFRGLGFSIDAIRTMLDNPEDARTLAQLQLHVLQQQLKALRRQEAIVQSALVLESDEDIRARLQLANAAASLAAEERRANVDAFLERASSGHRLSNPSKIRQMALLDLPDELEPRQLEAWIELSALLHDDAFLEVLHKQQRPFDGDVDEALARETGPQMFAITREAQALYDRGATPEDPDVRAVAEKWLTLFARMMRREPDAAFRQWMIAFASETNDPRIERFWQLVGTLRGQCIPSFTKAYALLIDAMRTAAP